jgi:hypothetical protein
MAISLIRGRLVVESAGPVWHLTGGMGRGPRFNRGLLVRWSDDLSPKIKAAVGSTLPAVQLTDGSGHSVRLLNARITGFGNEGKGEADIDILSFSYGASLDEQSPGVRQAGGSTLQPPLPIWSLAAYTDLRINVVDIVRQRPKHCVRQVTHPCPG